MSEQGKVHLYAGDGKGKTTAALGLSVRAKGAGRSVLIVQFLKGRKTSELEPLSHLGIAVLRTDGVEKFTFQMNAAERAQCEQSCIELLRTAHNSVVDGCCCLLVLDEVLDAINAGMLPESALLALLEQRGPCEVVLTGRGPSPAVEKAADYYTKMTAAKHPYQAGAPARLGIEF